MDQKQVVEKELKEVETMASSMESWKVVYSAALTVGNSAAY